MNCLSILSKYKLTEPWKALLFLLTLGTLNTVLFNIYYIGVVTERDAIRTLNKNIPSVTIGRPRNTTPNLQIVHVYTHLTDKSETRETKDENIKIKLYEKKSNIQINTLDKRNTDSTWTKFRFNLDTDMVDLVRRYKENGGVAEKPVFPYLYNFTYSNIERCSTDGLLFILLIKSAVENVERRKAIRATWAEDSELQKHNAIRKFLVGMGHNNNITREESDLHEDIMQISFWDHYYNNTLKTIGGIHWVAEHCSRAKFVVMADDDMFVATPRVSHYLKVNISANTSFYGGYVFTHHPARNKDSKFYVSKEDYPYDVYPIMPSGGFTIMSMTFVIDVHIASQYTEKFIFDNCYMGILAYRLHVQPKHIPTVTMWNVSSEKTFKTILAAHQHTPKTLKAAWMKLRKQEWMEIREQQQKKNVPLANVSKIKKF